jgi:hypothetical protein
MSKKFLTQIDFSKLEAYNFRLQNLATDPSAPAVGQLYFKTADNTPRLYNGTSFINLLDRANHSGTQVAATISDLASTVKAYKLNEFAAPTANIPMAGFTLTGLAAPTAAGQAAEYSWVLGQIQAAAAGIDNKASVVAVATANIAALTGLPTVDGVTLTAGQRLLLVGQTTASQNGVYAVAAGAWTRDVDTITPQAFWFVEQGTVNAGTQWKVSTSGAITVGSTAIAISQFGASNTYSAGNGIQLAGNVFSILLQASSGLVSTGAGLAIDTSVVARKFSATFGDGSATNIAITHNLGTRDVVVQVYDAASFDTIECDVVRTNTTQVTLGFPAGAPAANSLRVVVTG